MPTNENTEPTLDYSLMIDGLSQSGQPERQGQNDPEANKAINTDAGFLLAESNLDVVPVVEEASHGDQNAAVEIKTEAYTGHLNGETQVTNETTSGEVIALSQIDIETTNQDEAEDDAENNTGFAVSFNSSEQSNESELAALAIKNQIEKELLKKALEFLVGCKSFHNLFSGMDEVAPDAFILATNNGSKIKADISAISPITMPDGIDKDDKLKASGVQLSASAPISAEKELARMAVMIANFCKIIDADANLTLKIWGSKSYCEQVKALAKGSVNIEIIDPPSSKHATSYQESPVQKPSVLDDLVAPVAGSSAPQHDENNTATSQNRLAWNPPIGRTRATL